MMKKLVAIAALMLAIALSLAACGEAKEKAVNHTYGWLFIDGEKLAEGDVTWWKDYRDFIVVEIDGKKYRTAAENVVIVEMPEPVQPEVREARPC